MNEKDALNFGAKVTSSSTRHQNTPTTTPPKGHYTMRHIGSPNQSETSFEQSSKKLPSGTSFLFGQNTAPLIADTPLGTTKMLIIFSSFSKVFAPRVFAVFRSDRDEKISHKEAPKNRY